LNKSFKNAGFLKSIDIYPTFSLFWATPNIITTNFSEDFLKETWLINQFPPNRLAALFAVSGDRGNTLYDGLLTILGVDKNIRFTLLNKSLSLPVNFQFSDRLSFFVTFSYLFTDKLNLGTITKDQDKIETLRRFFPRLESTLSKLDTDISFENEDNSTYLSLSISYFLRFEKKK